MINKATEFKKRLMFLKGEDLYFYVYNTIVLLRSLSCESQQNAFYDYSKIAFLIDFVADSRLTRLIGSLMQDDTHPGESDIQQLQSVYTEGLARRHIMSRLIFNLDKRGIASLDRQKGKDTISVWLKTEAIPSDFFDTDLYDAEVENVKLIKKVVPRIRTMTLDTMIARLYTENGVLTWHV